VYGPGDPLQLSVEGIFIIIWIYLGPYWRRNQIPRYLGLLLLLFGNCFNRNPATKYCGF
jgi:hypothetical protein